MKWNSNLYDNAQSYVSAYGKSLIKSIPTEEEHKKILEKNNFIIKEIYSFDRPTELPNGILGLKEFILQFFSSTLKKISSIQSEKIITLVEEELKHSHFNGQFWTAEYHRLRVVDIKK